MANVEVVVILTLPTNWWLIRILMYLLLEGIEERCNNQKHQQQDEGADEPRHLRLAARGLLDERLGQSGAGREAAEKRRQDVAEADGEHLLVGVHRVAVLLGEHFRQRDGDGEAHDGDGEGVDGHVGDQRPHGQLGGEEASGDVPGHARAVLGVEVTEVRRQGRDDHHEELEGDRGLVRRHAREGGT